MPLESDGASSEVFLRDTWKNRGKRNPFSYAIPGLEGGDYYEFGRKEVEELCLPFLDALSVDRGVALEIGCGPGRTALALATVFDKLWAYDVSETMVAPFRELVEKHQLDNVELRINDGLSFPDIPDASVDFVFSSHVFIHIPNLDAMRANLREIKRVLKPSGAYQINVAMFEGSARFFGVPVPRKLLMFIPRSVRFWLLWAKLQLERSEPPERRTMAHVRGSHGVVFTRRRFLRLLEEAGLAPAELVHYDGFAFFQTARGNA